MTDLTFLDFHKPALPEGSYTVTATLDAKGPEPVTGGTFSGRFSATPDVTFQVGGPLTGLHTADVVSVFPPENSSGDFRTVLPHIVLSNPTLPFARIVETVPGAPSLALLLLTQAELDANGGETAFVAIGGGTSGPAEMERITLDDDTLHEGRARRGGPGTADACAPDR